MYLAITSPGSKGFKIEDWKAKEVLFNTLTEGLEPNEDGNYKFEDRDSISFKISDHNTLLKDLKETPFIGLASGAKKAAELEDRLKNCETIEAGGELEDQVTE